jgi:hypothetical protein
VNRACHLDHEAANADDAPVNLSAVQFRDLIRQRFHVQNPNEAESNTAA